MALTPLGVQLSTKYTLTGPDGTIATFNDSTDANFVGYITELTGLDSPEVRENADNVSGADGGTHGAFYYGRRPITMSGEIINVVSNEDRNKKLTKLAQASNAMRANAKLEWTPEGGEAVFVEVRRQQALRVTGGWAKQFQLLVVSADPRIYSSTLSTQTVAVTEAAATAAGTAPKGIVGSPDGKNVYVVNKGANTIQVYDRNLSTGELTSKETKATGTSPWDLAITPNGEGVFVANSGSANITCFKRAANGVLTLVETKSTEASGEEPRGIGVAINGLEAHVACFKNSRYVRYTIEPATMKLTFVESKVVEKTGATDLVVDPTNNGVFYIACSTGKALVQFHFEGAVLEQKPQALTFEPLQIAAVVYTSTQTKVSTIGAKEFKQGVASISGTYGWPFFFGGSSFPSNNLSALVNIEGERIFATDETKNQLIQLPGGSTTYSVGTGPGAIGYVAGATGVKSLYVSNGTANTITSFQVTPSFALLKYSTSKVTCTNKGSMETYPIVRLTVENPGSITNPTITNLTTGEAIVFSGTYSAGQSLVLNMANRTALLGTGATAFPNLNVSASKWWLIQPGANEIAISGESISGTAKLTVEWRSAWV